LAPNVAFLDPAPGVFDAMLEGWAMQQRTRFLKRKTIESRLDLVRRFAVFTGLYPWQWQPVEVEAFFDHLRCGPRPIVVSTARGYQTTLRMFMEYVTDARYGWPATCLERFAGAPVQILHEDNSVVHVVDYEGRPGRRPLTYDEVQALFDAADGRAEQIQAKGRKGVWTAMRDAALLKTVYAFGLRRREVVGLDLADLRRNPRTPGYGRFGPHPALWVSERRGRLATRGANEAFAAAREAAGLPAGLDLHCLRHSYVTHLVEFDYPERFVSEQVGHAYAATTAIYTGVSDEYRNRLLHRALRQRHSDMWEEES
jgi:integrase/recombinase XerD